MRPIRGLLIFYAIFLIAPQGSLAAPVVEWIRQFGTSGIDYNQESESVADGQGNFYVAGSTYGAIGGMNAGDLDGYVTKYDANGTQLWSRQIGTSSTDYVNSIAVDTLGNLYVTGASGDLAGPSAGLDDLYLRKYNPAGDVLWTRQQGTALNDRGYGVAADALANVYVVGGTQGAMGATNQGFSDPILRRYNSAGELVWARQWGTAEREWATTTDVDPDGNVFVVMETSNNFGVPVIQELRKLNPSGDLLWSRTFSNFGDLETDSFGNVVVSGKANYGRSGVFAKLNAQGEVVWTHPISTGAISTDAQGNFYAAIGAREVEKYSPTGELLWTVEIEEDANPAISRLISNISVDALGNIFVSGPTRDRPDGPSANFRDVWVALIRDQVPEPNSVLLCGIAVLGTHTVFSRSHMRRASLNL